jgi:hypothetical protein
VAKLRPFSESRILVKTWKFDNDAIETAASKVITGMACHFDKHV